MVNLDKYFRAWRHRLDALKGSLVRIKLLSKDAQFMQAILVRNACLDFLTELEFAFESILSDYICQQDEFFLAAVDDMHLCSFNKKSWPLDSDVPTRIAELKANLVRDVQTWSAQAADFEASIMLVQEAYKKEVHVILGELTTTHGVSPRIRKKKR